MKKLIIALSMLVLFVSPAFAAYKDAPNVSNATGTLPISNGGTGATTGSAAFDSLLSLSGTTSSAQFIIRDSDGSYDGSLKGTALGTWPAIGSTYSMGTTASPILTPGPTVKISRIDGVDKSDCGNDKNDVSCNAALSVRIKGMSTTTMMSTAGSFFSQSDAGAGGYDALGIWAYGRMDGSSVGTGGYLEGARYNTNGYALAGEMRTTNGAGAPCDPYYLGLAKCDGLFITAGSDSTVNTLSSALHIGATASGRWSEGLTCNLNAVKSGGLCINDQSGAGINTIGSYKISALNAISLTATGNPIIGNTAMSGVNSPLSIAIGYKALNAATATEAYSVAVGHQALALSTGTGNTALGYLALAANTTGSKNIAIGQNALYTLTTGGDNVAIGPGALGATITGSGNVAIGRNTLSSNKGGNNTVIGVSSLSATTTGNNNTSVGVSNGSQITSGSFNVLMGSGVASSTLSTGSRNILIGTSASVDTPAADTNNFLNIGNTIYATGLNSASSAVGIGTSAPRSEFDVGAKTGSLILPTGTAGQRPSSPINGMIRYNSTSEAIEIYQASSTSWETINTPAYGQIYVDSATGILTSTATAGTYYPIVSTSAVQWSSGLTSHTTTTVTENNGTITIGAGGAGNYGVHYTGSGTASGAYTWSGALMVNDSPVSPGKIKFKVSATATHTNISGEGVIALSVGDTVKVGIMCDTNGTSMTTEMGTLIVQRISR